MDREAIESRLTDADFSMSQSKVLSHILAGMATSQEVQEMRQETRAEFKAVRAEMANESRAVRAEMANEFRLVRGEMQLIKTELLGALATSVSDLRTDIERSARETQARLLTTMVSLIISLAAIFTLLDIFID